MTDERKQMEFFQGGTDTLNEKDNGTLSSNGSLDNDLKLDYEQMKALSQISGDKARHPGQKLTILQAIFALVTANIGGGILGLPFAFYHMGVTLAVILVCSVSIFSIISSMMLLKIKDLTPRHYESMYEIAFLLLGRQSIFYLCAIQFISIYGAMILYYIIIGHILSSFAQQALIESAADMNAEEIEKEMTEYPLWTQIACSRQAAILLVGLVLLVIVFKKQISELKIVSQIFIVMIVGFIVLMTSEVIDDTQKISESVDFDDLMRMKVDKHLITSAFIILFAYSIQFMVFPTYVELEKKSNERFSRVIVGSSAIYTLAYLSLGVIGALMFGESLQSDFLVNMATRDTTISKIIRGSFAIILMFHIPYFFFNVKEQVLVIYDEIANRSLSTHLEAKLADYYKAKNNKETFTNKKKNLHYLDKTTEQPVETKEVQGGENSDQESMDTDNLVERDETQPQQTLEIDSASSIYTVATDKSELTYKKLSDSVFFWTAVLLHVTSLGIAMSVESIDTVFEFTGAIGCSSIMFLFPGLGYILALREFGSSHRRKKWETSFYHFMAWLFLVIYLLAISTYIYTLVLKLLGQMPKQASVA